MSFKKILCPIDFSEYSYEALEYAKTIAKTFNSKLYVLHIIYEPADFTGFYVPHISFDKIRTEIESGAKKIMEEVKEKRIQDLLGAETMIIFGVPADEIVRFAKDKEIDLIVIGSQGKKGIEKMVFGSTAEKVVRKANCPVLVIKPKA